ncbi:MAG: tape measure protein [Propionibacteriaceae bacterium]|jgi:tape measure domain-containing protein|nr:tape measure protein [Propionibacteriaceae bacterium]
MANGPEVARATVVLVPKFEGVKEEIRKELGDAGSEGDKQGKETGNRFAGGFKKLLLGGIILSAVKSAFNGVKSVISEAFNVGSEMISFTKQLEILTGNAQTAGTMINSLYDYAQGSVLDTRSVVEAAKNLVGFGVEAERATDLTQMLGNASAIYGAQLSNTSVVLGQIYGAGKLMAQDAMQLINQGIPIFQLLGDTMGMTVTEVREQMSKGAISFDMVADALERVAGDPEMLKRFAETPAAALANLEDSMDGVRLAFMGVERGTTGFEASTTGLQTVVSRLMNSFAALMSSDGVQNFVGMIGGGLADGIQIAVDMIDRLTTSLDGGGAGFDGLAKMLPQVMMFMNPFAAILKNFVLPVLPQILAAIKPLIPVLLSLLDSILMPMLSLVESLIVPLVELIAGVLPPIVELATMLITALQPLLELVLAGLVYLINDLVSNLLPIIITLMQTVVPIIMSIVESFMPLITMIIENVMPVITSLAEFIVPIFEGIAKFIGAALGTIKAVIDVFMGLFSGDWDAFWTSIKDFLASVWETIATFFTNIWDNIKGIFGAAWEAIKSIVMTPVNAVKDAVIGAFNTVKDGIQKAIGGIKDFVSMVFNGIAGVIKAPINAIIGLVNGAIGALNKISVSVPDWVPIFGGRRFGFNLGTIAYLAEGATVLPKNGGTLAVLAEAGKPETVVDTGKMNRLLDQVAADRGEPKLGIAEVLTLMNRLLEAVEAGQIMILDTGELVGATAGQMNQSLAAGQARSGRQVAWA